MPFYTKELHDKYGDVVRIAPDELCYRNAESWKSIYGVQPRGTNNSNKDPRFFVKEVNNEPSLVTANDAVHGQYKRVLSQAFSEKYLKEQEHLIQHFCDLLVKGIRKKTIGKDATTDSVDIVQWINWCTFDLGSALLLGESFNCLENSNYHPWVSIVVAFPKAYAYVATPNYYPIVAKVLERLIPKSLLQKRLDHHSMIREKVDRRIAEGPNQPDILKIIESHDGTPLEMSREALYSNCEALIIAASETSGTLLAGLMFHVLSTPRVHKKLVEEIRSTFKSEKDMTVPSLRALEYLGAVVEEGLRMFPPTPTGLPRVVPPEGKVISGEFIPAGVGFPFFVYRTTTFTFCPKELWKKSCVTNENTPSQTAVSVCQWSAFHSESNFKDPEAFIPERWLGDERFASDKKEALQPFGMGPRGCLGKV